jgi:hypothetical protein
LASRNRSAFKGGDVAESNEPDEFRQRQDLQDRRRWIVIRVLDVLIALALAAMTALVLKMILY